MVVTMVLSFQISDYHDHYHELFMVASDIRMLKEQYAGMNTLMSLMLQLIALVIGIWKWIH